MALQGNELRWRFTSDGSVNGWGWRFTVYPVISAGTALNGETQSERLLLARPSISAVACLLDALVQHLRLDLKCNGVNSVASRLAMALAGCAHRSSLGTVFNQRKVPLRLFFRIGFSRFLIGLLVFNELT